jgi:hypothetical protein
VDSQQLTSNNMTSTAKKGISGADTCVWVCCPSATETCPTTDQCP